MASLAFAPIVLVQPIGILALVFSVVINAKLSHQRPDRAVFRAVSITLVGVVAYVTIASMVTTQHKISDRQLIEVLVALGLALAIAATIRIVNHGGSRRAPIIYVLLAGVFSAFVATLGKTVIMRVEALFSHGHLTWGSGSLLTLACLIGMGIASALSIYFTQHLAEPGRATRGRTPGHALSRRVALAHQNLVAWHAPLWRRDRLPDGEPRVCPDRTRAADWHPGACVLGGHQRKAQPPAA